MLVEAVAAAATLAAQVVQAVVGLASVDLAPVLMPLKTQAVVVVEEELVTAATVAPAL
jgi:hypothetical protein